MTIRAYRMPPDCRHMWLAIHSTIEAVWSDDRDDENTAAVRPPGIGETTWRRIQLHQRAVIGMLAYACQDWAAWSAQQHGCMRARYWEMGHRNDDEEQPRWPVHAADHDRCQVAWDYADRDPTYRECLPQLHVWVPNTDEAEREWCRRLRQMLAEISPLIGPSQ
jgi:hypothetical protein